MRTMEEPEIVIREFLAANFVFDDTTLQTLAATDSLLGMGILDSQGMMEMVGYVEKTWGLCVADDDLIPENFDSIAAVSRFILSRKKQ